MSKQVSLRKSTGSILATLAAFAIATGSVTADEGRGRETKPAVQPSASLLAASAASQTAQTGPSREERRRIGMVKILSGLGLSAAGVIMAANSGGSVTVQDPFFRETTKISARSNGRLYGGLGLAGAGGVLIYLGAKDRSAAASPSLAFEVGPRTRVVFQKRW